MHVRDAARAITDVLELGVDDDVVARIRRFDSARGADPGGSTTDHQDPVRHERSPQERVAARSFSIGNA
jgi:hypothetical protein